MMMVLHTQTFGSATRRARLPLGAASPSEGRCPYCHHVRGLWRDGVVAIHTYLGSALCPGTDQPPD